MKDLYLVLGLLIIVIILLIIDYRSGFLFGFKIGRSKINDQEDENEDFYPYGFNYDIYGTDDYSAYFPWYGYGYPWYNSFYPY